MDKENSPPVETKAPKVYQAISNVMFDLSKDGIVKNRENTQGNGFKFRGIDDVYNALAPILAKHKLLVIPRILTRTQEERTARSGGALFYTTVDAEFDFISAEDGSWHKAKMFGEAMDSGDKSTSKAMSVAFREACIKVFCIPTEGDNDADSNTPEPLPKGAAKKTEAAKTADGRPTPLPPSSNGRPKPQVKKSKLQQLLEGGGNTGWRREDIAAYAKYQYNATSPLGLSEPQFKDFLHTVSSETYLEVMKRKEFLNAEVK